MRVLYLIPGPMSKGPLGSQELIRRQSVLQKYAVAGTELAVCDTETGPASIESVYEEYLAIPAALKEIRRAEQEGFDAIIVGCFGDPGVDGGREIVNVPVIGPCESSLHLGAMLGYYFSVVTVLDNVKPVIRRVLRDTGLESRLASIRVIQTAVLDLANSRKATLGRLIEAGKRAIDEDGADTLILGCMSLAFLEVDQELSQALGVPVINPATAALKAAETLVSLRLRPSKKAFPVPVKEVLSTAI